LTVPSEHIEESTQLTAAPVTPGAGDTVAHAPTTARASRQPAKAPDADADNTLFGRLRTLTNELRHPTLPGGLVDQPDQSLTLITLRAVLLPEGTPVAVRDRVWQHLAIQIQQRRDSPRQDWFLYALGLILPGLWRTALRLAPPPDASMQRIRHVQTVLAEEFCLALDRFPPTTGYLWKRCLNAATHQAKTSANRRPADPLLLGGVDLTDLADTHQTTRHDEDPGRHHDEHLYQVLNRLVRRTAHQPAGQRLTRADAQLLALTYLDGHTLVQAADLLGLSEPTARGRQARARYLVAHLLTTDTDPTTTNA
jgi:DNA-directed RNA polymerase specialized sigma24 family protein